MAAKALDMALGTFSDELLDTNQVIGSIIGLSEVTCIDLDILIQYVADLLNQAKVLYSEIELGEQ